MTQSLTPDIVEAIADAKGVEAEELDISLYEYVETDAIERLISHETTAWTLSFELPDHTVTVTGDGVILVDGTKKALWA